MAEMRDGILEHTGLPAADLERAGWVPIPATGLTPEAIMQDKSEVSDMRRAEIESL
jgi:hypothetical protein